MRENRQSGSAGGEAGITGLPYPDSNWPTYNFPHKGGYRSVLYTDFHVQAAFYAATSPAEPKSNLKYPNVDGTATPYFIWKVEGNAW